MSDRETMNDLYATLANTARGDLGREAAVDLLYRHARWLPTLYAWGWLTDLSQDEYLGDDQDGYAPEPWIVIQWTAIAATLDTGVTRSMPEHEHALLVGTDSERSVLRIACSLAADSPTGLRSSLSGLDRVNLRLVLHAIVHATQGEMQAHRAFPLNRPATSKEPA
ncbi:hypothetical protein [Streptomyces sp. NPDC057302]|uniref:hypothetical protein n=1 Tax=Streptomyces sp. NPDC057302 TaxID=3346094 RepID=UPI003624D5A9